MRSPLLATLIAAWLLSPPAAEAQALGTWCTPNFMQPTSSAHLQACYDLADYSTSTMSDPSGDLQILNFTGQWYGSFFTALSAGTASFGTATPFWSPLVTLPSGRIYSSDLVVFDPAIHTQPHTFTTLPTPVPAGAPAPTLNQILDPTVTVFTIDGLPDATLVAVPEPGTYLLMLTGLMGLGIVARRRRGESSAQAYCER